MSEITLTQGMVALIDEEDYLKISKYAWHYEDGYARSTIDRQKVLLHRFVLSAADDVWVDHRDGNPLNCKKHNLRSATPAQNTMNSRLRSDSTSGYKGVSWIRKTRKWHAYIYNNGRKEYLGYYQDPVEAAKAYDRRAKVLFGEYARLNFPEVTSGLEVGSNPSLPERENAS